MGSSTLMACKCRWNTRCFCLRGCLVCEFLSSPYTIASDLTSHLRGRSTLPVIKRRALPSFHSYVLFHRGNLGAETERQLFIFYGFYDIGFTVLPNLYVPEILPYHLRTKGMSIYIFAQAIVLAFVSLDNTLITEKLVA